MVDGQDAPCRFAALRGTAQEDWGGHLTVGFASPLSRLRSTHGYALAAAYAALLCGKSPIGKAYNSPSLVDGQDAPCRFAALRGTAQEDWGGHLTVGFASPLSRLRSTHGYALAAA
ncbi:MAG: hypothetical protein IKP00_06750, partial [Victivallales bacterium]|nr:hypothetical protein [Victivallales bacterium]